MLVDCEVLIRLRWNEHEIMNQDSEHSSNDSGHEPVEPKMSPIVMSLAGLLGIVLLSMLLVGLALSYFSHEHQNVPRVTPQPEKQPAIGPALDASQADDQKQLRLHQEKLLSEYEWIDQKDGIARIPISRAMEIMSQKMKSPTNNLRPGGVGHD
jgi:hypothetical protein